MKAFPDASSDSPAWTVTNTAGTRTTSWYALGLDGSLAAQIDAAMVTYQLTNLHGDVVAAATPADTAAWSGVTVTSDEYGVTTSTTTDPSTGAPTAVAGPRYGWLGAHQRATDGQGGLTLMGVRLYNPVTGLFLSTDPVYGGNPNTYTYPVNPITMYDLDGRIGYSPGRPPRLNWTRDELIDGVLLFTLFIPGAGIASMGARAAMWGGRACKAYRSVKRTRSFRAALYATRNGANARRVEGVLDRGSFPSSSSSFVFHYARHGGRYGSPSRYLSAGENGLRAARTQGLRGGAMVRGSGGGRLNHSGNRWYTFW